MAKATLHFQYRHLRAFFNWFHAHGYVQNSPEMGDPETYERLPKAVHKKELKRICDAIRTDYEEKRRKGVVFAEGQLISRIPVFCLRASHSGGTPPCRLPELPSLDRFSASRKKEDCSRRRQRQRPHSDPIVLNDGKVSVPIGSLSDGLDHELDEVVLGQRRKTKEKKASRQ